MNELIVVELVGEVVNVVSLLVRELDVKVDGTPAKELYKLSRSLLFRRSESADRRPQPDATN
jgi:hypothetical protein